MSGTWWRREALVEAVLAATVALTATFGVWDELANAPWPTPTPLPGYALTLAACGVLVFRRRRPVAVTVVALALLYGYHLAGYPGGAPALALFVAVYSVSAYGRDRWSLPVAIALTAAACAVPQIPPHPLPFSNAAVYGPTIGILSMAVLGATIRQRRLDAEERVRQAHAQAEAQTRQRLTDERLRIARELHDVLAHTISVIAVQGGLALDALDDNPELTRQAVQTMRSSAREALTELRAALAALRGEGDPQPRAYLAEVPALAEAARAAGLVVEVDTGGTGELPPLHELTAYRIVQEALTNAVRHSGAGHAWVLVRRELGTLRVEVSDDGHGLPDEPASGMGLRGMRERVRALSGTLHLGAREGGGCRIVAELPL